MPHCVNRSAAAQLLFASHTRPAFWSQPDGIATEMWRTVTERTRPWWT